MQHRIKALILAVWALMLVLAPPMSKAYAEDCINERAIFWGATSSNGNWKADTHGTRNVIRWSDRTLDTFCGAGTDLAWSTAHFALSIPNLQQVEVGWSEQWNTFKTQHVRFWFVEWQNGSNCCAFYDEQPFDTAHKACTPPAFGGYVVFRVTNTPIGTSNYNFDVSCDGGSTWHVLDTIQNTLDDNGTPFVETGRRGDTTGESDDQQNLQWKDVNNQWNPWYSAKCSTDGATDWNGNVYSQNPVYWQTLPAPQGQSC